MNVRREPLWHETTAIFGGRFDPPHLGHLEAVQGLFRYPGVKAVRVIPAAAPAHKATSASMTDRAEMSRLCFPDEVTVDLRELKRAEKYPDQPSYSFDTLQELKNDFASLAFVIGTDQLAQLTEWHRFPEILSLCHWIVLERRPNGKELALKTLQEWKASGLVQQGGNDCTWVIARTLNDAPKFLQVCPTEAAQISSSSIREQIALSGSVSENLLLPEVLTYLKDHKLYGT